MIHECPNCRKKFVIMAGAGNSDFVHKCYDDDETFSEEDVVEIRKPHWNLQGLSDGMLWLQSNEASDSTDRGERESTHYQRQHHEYIKLENNENIEVE